MVAKHSGLRPDSNISASFASRRHSLLSFAVAVALGVPGVSLAQESSAVTNDELEEVVVTGIRASIQDSIQVKSEIQSVSEVISAEDIGKLPDTSIADSIARVPGVTTQRAEGKASLISIRGTDPGFAVGLMNGREQVSTGDNRAIEYDQYPSELINQVIIYKTPDSQLFAQGLSGTIDLRTIRPLDYGKQAVTMNIRGELNSQGDLGANASDTGHRASISYVDQFMEGKLGVALGFARLDSPIATKAFGAYEPWELASRNQWNADLNADVPPDAYITKGLKARTDMGRNIRDGYLATVEFRPNDSYGTVLDLYYTDASSLNNARSLEVNLGGYPAPCCDSGPFPPGSLYGYSDPVIKGGAVVGGTLNNVLPIVRNFKFTTDDKIFAGGWLNEFRVNDQWQIRADLGYSKATRDQVQFETNGTAQWLTAPIPDDPNIPGDQSVNPHWPNVNGSMRLPTGGMGRLGFDLNTLADASYIELGPTIYGAGYAKKPHVEDELWSGSLIADTDADFWWFNKASFGFNYTDRKKDKTSRESSLSTIGSNWYQIDPQFLLKDTNLNYSKSGKVLAWGVDQVVNNYFNDVVWGTPFCNDSNCQKLTYLAGKWWNVDEKVWTGLARGELDHVISDSVTLKGNFGVQLVYTDQSSGSYEVDNRGTGDASDDIVTPVNGGKTYTDVLPQMNLVFQLPDQQDIRFAVAASLARARMDQLKASTEYGYNESNGQPGGASGDPELDPWRAWNFDLAYDKYFADYQGYFSVALFYKDLESYIYSTTDTNYDFCANGFDPPPPDPNDPTPPIYQCIGSFTTPKNGKGGYLQGLELAVSVPFNLITESLDGFGIEASYAYTDSNIKIDDTPSGSILPGNSLGSIPLPGLSENVANGTVYYEKYGFAARFAARYRSKYIGEVTNFANERALRYVDGGTFMDAQVSYGWDEGMLDGLTLLFQINNISNEPYYAYNQNKARFQDYQEYGTVYLLGASYKFGGN